MRAIFISVAVAMSALMADAQVVAKVGPGISQRSLARTAPTPHNHPSSPLLFETFDTPSGYDLAGWNFHDPGNGSVDPDYTATVLSGTQSFFLDGSDDEPLWVTNSFAASGHVWVYFQIRSTAHGTGVPKSVIRLMNASDTCQFRLTLETDGGLQLKIWPQCTASSAQTAFGMSLNTTYHVWVEYWNDNGANSFASVGFSTSPVRPTSGDNFVSFTEASSAVNVSRILIGSTADENSQPHDFLIDYLLIDDAQIGDYP